MTLTEIALIVGFTHTAALRTFSSYTFTNKGTTLSRRDTLFIASFIATPVSAHENGSQLFAQSCAACHSNGGNIVARGKTLHQRDLDKNGYESLESIEALIAKGKNAMPGYGELCEPKRACTYGPRLSSAQIADVASYVQAEARTGWSASN